MGAGEGFASCVAANGAVKSSRNGEVSLAAAGDVSLYWDGIAPVAVTHLDEELGLSANLVIAKSAPPGDHRYVGRCVDDADEEGMGTADSTVPPSSEVVAVVPDRNTIDDTAVDYDDTAPSPVTPVVNTALAVPDNPDRVGTVEHPSVQSNAPIPADNAGNRTIGAETTLSGTGPMAGELLIGALILMGGVLAALALTPVVLQARRGPEWVRANVRAVAEVAPAMSVELAPQIDDYWPPTSIVRFALHADSGTQILTEVKQ